jgi:hypothetical protein
MSVSSLCSARSTEQLQCSITGRMGVTTGSAWIGGDQIPEKFAFHRAERATAIRGRERICEPVLNVTVARLSAGDAENVRAHQDYGAWYYSVNHVSASRTQQMVATSDFAKLESRRCPASRHPPLRRCLIAVPASLTQSAKFRSFRSMPPAVSGRLCPGDFHFAAVKNAVE